MTVLDELLAYLNLSSGTPDVHFRRNLNQLFAQLAASSGEPAAWRRIGQCLRQRLDEAAGESAALRDAGQARGVLAAVWDIFPGAYRNHHRDLLFHQTDEGLFQPLFLARACELAIAQGPPWDEHDRIAAGTVEAINDFIGYRPVATLNTPQKIQPYANEWVAPIPLYFKGVGAAGGVYQALVERTLAILVEADADLLHAAQFDPEQMDELALDPRAYDFDHPANRRPAYLFGQWDPHHLDNQGRYRRFVLVQATVDAMLARVHEPDDVPAEERLEEAANVLAGTMLMAAGISGSGPGAHDSSVTLATLLPRVAAYRDEFYQRRLRSAQGAFGRRLRSEARQRKQPFGGARQDLNQRLARLRAAQLQQTELARLFARLGAGEASLRQLHTLPTASARMRCELECRIATAHRALDRHDLAAADADLAAAESLLHRAIQCGALVDPWNILGFGGAFPVFPAPENSVSDPRVEELLDLMQRLFALAARLLSESAAAGDEARQAQLERRLRDLASWWDQFATTTVGDLPSVVGAEALQSAVETAGVLAAWREGGEAAGDVAFWRQHVDYFRSPRSFWLVLKPLLDRRDLMAAMALLMQWLSQVSQMPLEEGEASFHVLAVRWLRLLYSGQGGTPGQAEERWRMTRRFFDFLEANAEEYWHVPDFEFQSAGGVARGHDEEDDERPTNLFAAAYEEMVYRDTTDDGVDSSLLGDSTGPTVTELDFEATRLGKRLSLLVTVAGCWRLAAAAALRDGRNLAPADEAALAGEYRDALAAWHDQARQNLRRLYRLLTDVADYPLPPPGTSRDSLLDFDRRQMLKLSLIQKIVSASVETAGASRMLWAVVGADHTHDELAPWEQQVVSAVAALLRGDRQAVRNAFPALLDALRSRPLLYVPLVRGGRSQQVLAAGITQQIFRELLQWLPRLGLLRETCLLIETAQTAELNHGLGPGAVTEFDQLFDLGYAAVAESLIMASADWEASPQQRDAELIDTLQRATRRLFPCWSAHNANVRVSVVAAYADQEAWKRIVAFIKRYGGDLFTPRFLSPTNLRAIQHRGVDEYLKWLNEDPNPPLEPTRLLEDLDRRIPRREAVACLEQIFETILENHVEFQDYQMTTTQSDRGEMLYTLLDFLRVKASYQRIAHSLRPAMTAHRLLVRHGRQAAAEAWRREVARQTSEAADRHVQWFERLVQTYGMRLPTIADRVAQRFVRPMALDRASSLLPAVVRGGPAREETLAQLEQEIAEFARDAGGGGVEVPQWLEDLHHEVDRLLGQQHAKQPSSWEDNLEEVARVALGYEEAAAQFELD